MVLMTAGRMDELKVSLMVVMMVVKLDVLLVV